MSDWKRPALHFPMRSKREIETERIALDWVWLTNEEMWVEVNPTSRRKIRRLIQIMYYYLEAGYTSCVFDRFEKCLLLSCVPFHPTTLSNFADKIITKEFPPDRELRLLDLLHLRGWRCEGGGLGFASSYHLYLAVKEHKPSLVAWLLDHGHPINAPRGLGRPVRTGPFERVPSWRDLLYPLDVAMMWHERGEDLLLGRSSSDAPTPVMRLLLQRGARSNLPAVLDAQLCLGDVTPPSVAHALYFLSCWGASSLMYLTKNRTWPLSQDLTRMLAEMLYPHKLTL